jgi:microcystin-dependent protein
MSEPFVAEIKIFAGNFAPRGYAFCNGQLLPIAQNTALFSLIGTTYGGDGRTTTALPDLQGRAPMHPGRGPGLSSYRLGQKSGVETVTLTTNEMAAHNHTAQGANQAADSNSPAGAAVAVGGGRGANAYLATPTSKGTLNQLQTVGGSQAHTNLQPFQAMYFIIALVGLYPSRS